LAAGWFFVGTPSNEDVVGLAFFGLKCHYFGVVGAGSFVACAVAAVFEVFLGYYYGSDQAE